MCNLTRELWFLNVAFQSLLVVLGLGCGLLLALLPGLATAAPLRSFAAAAPSAGAWLRSGEHWELRWRARYH